MNCRISTGTMHIVNAKPTVEKLWERRITGGSARKTLLRSGWYSASELASLPLNGSRNFSLPWRRCGSDLPMEYERNAGLKSISRGYATSSLAHGQPASELAGYYQWSLRDLSSPMS